MTRMMTDAEIEQERQVNARGVVASRSVAAADFEAQADALAEEARLLKVQLDALDAERIALPGAMTAAAIAGDPKAMRALRDRSIEAPFEAHAARVNYLRLRIAGLEARREQYRLEQRAQGEEIAALQAKVVEAQAAVDRYPTIDFQGDLSDVRTARRQFENELELLTATIPSAWGTRK